MPEAPNDIENFSPYKLIDNFTRSRTALCLVLALILHVLVIGGTSVPYIYSKWINPEAGKAEASASGGGRSASRPTTASAPVKKDRQSRVERDVTATVPEKDAPKIPKPKLDVPIE